MSVFGNMNASQGGSMTLAGTKGATVIKARYGTDIRRIPIINEELTYDDLILMMQRVFKLSEKDTVLVKYTDDDGDLVTILDNGDLSHAKTYGAVLRLTLFINGKGPTVTPSAQLQAELLQLSKAVATLSSKLAQLEPESEGTADASAPAEAEAAAAEQTQKSEPAPETPAPDPTPAPLKVDFGKDLDPLAASPIKTEPVEPSPIRPNKAAAGGQPQSAPQQQYSGYDQHGQPVANGGGYDQQQAGYAASGHGQGQQQHYHAEAGHAHQQHHAAPQQEYAHPAPEQYDQQGYQQQPGHQGYAPQGHDGSYFHHSQGHAPSIGEGQYDYQNQQAAGAGAVYSAPTQHGHPSQQPQQQYYSGGTAPSGQGYDGGHSLPSSYANVYEK